MVWFDRDVLRLNYDGERMAGGLPIATAGWHWLQSRKTGRAL